VGVFGLAPSGFGLYGTSTSGYGIFGVSSTGDAVYGSSASGAGIRAISNTGVGLVARSNGAGDIMQGLRSSTEVFRIDQNGRINITPTGSAGGSGAAFLINNADNIRSFEIQHTGANQAMFIRHTAPSNNAIDIQVDDIAANTDVFHIDIPAAAPDNCQFIGVRRGTDVEFRVDGDGNVRADGTFSGPADFAEMIEVSEGHANAEPGDVMVISTNKDRAVEKNTEANSTLIFGIYSTKPGFLGSERPWDEQFANNGKAQLLDEQYMKETYNEVPVAVVGIVPCKVSAENGPIKPGDLLVTSATPGHAMKAPANPGVGTILGKALGSLASGTGIIKVYVTVH